MASSKKKKGVPRNLVAGANRRVNVPKVEPDRTKYRRKRKHKHKGEDT